MVEVGGEGCVARAGTVAKALCLDISWNYSHLGLATNSYYIQFTALHIFPRKSR